MHPPRTGRRRATRLILVLCLLAPVAVLTAAPAAGDAVADVPPSHIRVCRSGGVATVAFDEYVKEVLAKEFPASWPAEVLKAGAVAVKSFGWYYIEHPYAAECDLTDTTRHQKYAPEDASPPRTAAIDRAVDATWHIRMEEFRNGETTPAFAQYCAGCGFTEGTYIDQYEAKAQADAGWHHLDILAHQYRAKSGLALLDWREVFGLRVEGEAPLALEDGVPLVIRAPVDGVAPGHPDVTAHLSVTCTLDGSAGTHLLQTVTIADDGQGPAATFDRADDLRRCAATEVVAVVRLTVNGWRARSVSIPVWEPWRSASPREVTRLADTEDPVAGAVAVSQEVFADAAPVTADDRRTARAVVLARSDTFPDALAATGLAGPSAPILLNPGGAPLRDDVSAEIDRILAAGGRVDLVGGPEAVSDEVATSLRDRGYDVHRHAGATRVETAVAVADAVLATGGDASVALVARAYPDTTAGWADAVTGGAYAATRRHPVLLTAPGSLHPATEGWIEGHGVAETVLLGGTAAVPGDAEVRLSTATTRVSGATRDGTAVAVAERLWSREGAPPIRGALIVDSYEPAAWPFALSAAVLAANRGTPELVVTRLVPRHTTGAWLDAHAGLPAIIVGAPRIVGDRVAADVAGG